MTLGTIFRSVLGPSSSLSTGYSTVGQKFLSERNSEYYHHGSHKHHKGKSKSDKKHAILSALTLLAFLFFLNILQNCIREQNVSRGTIMMFTPTEAPIRNKFKDPSQNFKSSENSVRKKRNFEMSAINQSGFNRKSRVLLGIDEVANDGGKRQVKFIRNFGSVSNWTKELSPMSEKDLDEQKLKTLNFPLYWKNNRFASAEFRSTLPPRVIQSPFPRNEMAFQMLRKFKKRERTSTSTEPMMQQETTLKTKPLATTLKTWDYRKPEKFQPSPYIPGEFRSQWFYNRTQNVTWQIKKDAAATPQMILDTTPTTIHSAVNYVATTPRNRRSDYSTPRPGEYDDYDRISEQTREDIQMSPTPALGLDLNTFQTFPVYNYYNHRPNSFRENQTMDVVTPEPTTPEIDRMHNELVRVTTQQPLFHPTKTVPLQSKPQYQKHRNRWNHYGYYHVRNHYPMESMYRYSPYRKTGVYEAPHFHDHVHDDYYPPVVLAKYEVQHDEPGFDLMKFLWAMVTSFAKPLTKLVPSFAKDNHEEAQCYDLLVCEAQRISRFMGPTAEALATTVGTLLTWAATEETRQIVVDAINSGRENTCQQQIRDCEDRSGGKSAMTVIAQVMEMKLR